MLYLTDSLYRMRQGLARQRRFVAWFDELSREDVALAGGKGANLAEMTRARVPVPPGFIVTSDAYFHFLKKTGLGGEIRELLNVFSLLKENRPWWGNT